ncbi:MAG: hypothetical protein AAGH68_09250 [Pseudomonadota bacterium]
MSHAQPVSVAIALQSPTAPQRPVADSFSAENIGVLNHIRIAALKCRYCAKAEPQEACRVLWNDPVVSKGAFAEVLVPYFAQALGRNVRIFSPGVADVSPDEALLLRLISSLRDGDHASAEFMLRSRIPKHMRRTISFLARGVA